VATPRLRHSPALHLFADMRNLLGVPNTLNVLTSYPLLLAGVPGLVLCLCGSGCFGVRCVAPIFAHMLFDEMSHLELEMRA
jgi:hypothetical protein